MRVALIVLLFLLMAKSAWCPWGIPKNLGPNVNWAGKDYYPSISADGTKLYFTSDSRPGGFGDDDIWISTWNGAEWTSPMNAGPYVNSDRRDLSPSISSDGAKLYFVSYGRPGGHGSYDVWVSVWQDTIWGPPANLGPNVNSPYDEFTTNISFDGKKIYFSSNRPGTHGDDDIWVCEWDSVSSQWGPAANLGRNINTFTAEYCPSVSSGGRHLYFASWRSGFGCVDIFVSQWQDTTWSKPVNLGSPVNGPTWDNGPSISSEGTELYFASSRDTSNPAVQDIWVARWRGPAIEEKQGGAVGVQDPRLFSIRPNPFVSGCAVTFYLPSKQDIALRVYDIKGSLVRVLVAGERPGGSHQVRWDGKNDSGADAPTGVYFCRLDLKDRCVTEKAILLR